MHKRYTLVTWSLPGFHVNVLLPAQRWLLLTPTCSASPCGCWSATWAHSSWYLVPVVCMEIVLSYWNSSKQGNGTGCLSWSVHSPALTGLSVPVGQHGVVVPINGSCARTASSDGLSWPPPTLGDRNLVMVLHRSTCNSPSFFQVSPFFLYYFGFTHHSLGFSLANWQYCFCFSIWALLMLVFVQPFFDLVSCMVLFIS